MVAFAHNSFTIPLDTKIRQLVIERAQLSQDPDQDTNSFEAMVMPLQTMVNSDFMTGLNTSVSHQAFKPANNNEKMYDEFCRRIQNNPQWKALAQKQDAPVPQLTEQVASVVSPAREQQVAFQARQEKVRKTSIELKTLYDLIAKANLTIAEAKDLLKFIKRKQVEKLIAENEKDNAMAVAVVMTQPQAQQDPDSEPGVNVLAVAALEERIGTLLPDESAPRPGLSQESLRSPLQQGSSRLSAFAQNGDDMAPAPAAPAKPRFDAHVEQELDFIARDTQFNLSAALVKDALAFTSSNPMEQARPLGQAEGVPVTAGQAARPTGASTTQPPGNEQKVQQLIVEAKQEQIEGLLHNKEAVYNSPCYIIAGPQWVKMDGRSDNVDLTQDLAKNTKATMTEVARKADRIVAELKDRNLDGVKKQVDIISNFTAEKAVLQDYEGTVRHIGKGSSQTRIISMAEMALQNKESALYQANTVQRTPGLQVA
jgi:hypothetical protein